MGELSKVRERYRQLKNHTKELLEEQILSAYLRRASVVAIDDDVLRKFRRDWSASPNRVVDWDWETSIVPQHRRHGPRGLDLALLVDGNLCALAVIRLSKRKRWLSITHVEGSPADNPLRGHVIPIVVMAAQIYRSQICSEGDHKLTGIRLLNPLTNVLAYYADLGYNVQQAKRLGQATVDWPLGDDHETAAKDAGFTFRT